MLLTIAAAALAWDIEPVFEEPLAGNTLAMALLPGSDPVLAARLDNGGGLEVIDVASRYVLAVGDPVGTALAWMPDGSGVVVCGAGGTSHVPWDGADLQDAVSLSADACEAVLPRTADVADLAEGQVYVTDGASWSTVALTGDLAGGVGRCPGGRGSRRNQLPRAG